MNKIESVLRAQALQSNDTKTFDSLLTATNGNSGGGFEPNDLVSFAPNYEKNKNLFLNRNNNFDSITFFITREAKYDPDNVVEVFSTLFVRRYGISDIGGTRHFPTIDGKVYEGMLINFLKEFANKTLKCVRIEEFETGTYGTRRVYHWETATGDSQPNQA